MERVKKPVCIVLFLSGALLACNRENTFSTDWRETRVVQARLTDAKWKPPQPAATLQTSCNEPVDSRDLALNLLIVADGDCLDKAVTAVARYANDDLAAAYLTRFERNDDPVDLLRALETAQGFNRALALEWLWLTREAIHAWNEAAKEPSDWASEAGRNRGRLQQLPDPLGEWNPAALEDAVKRRDAAEVTRIVRAFPIDAARLFEAFDLSDHEGARLFATALADAGEHYPKAVVDAMERPRDAKALNEGLAALTDKQYARAATLLARAGNPLRLAARYYEAADDGPKSALDETLPHLKPEYRELSSRIHTYRAYRLELEGKMLAAHADYDRALLFARNEPTATVRILVRRSSNYSQVGNAEEGFRDAHRALALLTDVADTNARNSTYGVAAIAARRLGHPLVALHYQNMAVDDMARAEDKLGSVVALRARAEIHTALGNHDNAERDLNDAVDFADAVDEPRYREPLRMRLRDVKGQRLMKTSPAAAAQAFTEAIELAEEHNPTYRAMLHFKRASAWRNAGDARADDDMVKAMKILRDEVRGALINDPAAASQPLWDPYFSRFRDMHHELIESRIDAGDVEGAFVHAELARAFEPMQILLQSRAAPPGYRPIETVADLRQAIATLPEDTVILQYLVLPKRTFTWVVTRGRVVLVPQRAMRAQVERWNADANAGIAAGQRGPFLRAMRAAYAELFREPLEQARTKTRIVVVLDEPMQGLPVSGLVGTADEGYLIERASIALTGSTSLYLYALARDRQLASDGNPPVLLIGDPPFPSKDPLPFARQEVQELARDQYPGAATLIGAEATVERFLAQAKTAGIIHFAGHALASQHEPWKSRLLFAADGQESGELNAETLMKELSRFDRTRLVVLGACSTAGGGSVGPQGLAPLVRPLIGARVPAVVGALWDVRDASTKELLVSFHCHYRHGDDVAVALRNAQLERLRKQEPATTAMQWAAFQVVGYAASPYPRPVALENPNSEHVCTQNSLHRPDGLHSQ